MKKILAAVITLSLIGIPVFVAADDVFDTDFPQVSSSTASNAPISGSCDTEGASISISITDGTTTVGPSDTTCSGGAWSANIDVSSLDDTLLTATISINGEESDVVNTQKDTTPPVITVYVGDGLFSLATSAEDYIFDTSDPLFEFNQEDGDGISTLTCSVDGGAPEDCASFSFQAAGLADGPHMLELDVISDIGNSDSLVTNFCVNTCDEEIEEPAETVQIAIRDGATLVGPIEIELPAEDALDVAIAPTGTTTTHNVPARSVLALLTSLDATSTEFEITDLAYFTSFSSFLVNCIHVPAASASADCFSWTYAVNGAFPSVGMDVRELGDGDIVYVFFGSAWQVSVSDSTVEEGESFTATIEKYDAGLGEYVPAEGEVAGAVQFDAFFTPTEFATSTTNAEGEASLSLSDAGEYAVGVQSVFYFPNATVTVSEPEEEEAPSGGGGGGGGGPSHFTFNVPAALAYLSTKQSADGSFGDPLFSDWVALAFAAQDPGSAKTALRTYMLSAAPTMTKIEDYERHAMALMALGIDPYAGTSVDYISPILAAFDGTQIGQSIVHDDIFAIFPLLRAGYSTADDIVQKLVAYIVSKQVNGSWGDPDTTAAAVQALTEASSLPGVSAALTSAQVYLHSAQQANGGFSNSFSTSWVMQAIAALGQNETQWAPASLYPRDYLAGLQQSDGGVEPVATADNTRVWATAYAIPGALGKTWVSLLSSFSKPTTPTGGGGAATPTATTTEATVATSTATSTIAVATSTPPVATSSTVAAILEEIADETPVEAFESRVALVSETEPNPEEEAPIESVETQEEALEQIAAAATTESQDWMLLVLAFLALVLFGIAGYTLFVRKYWR